MDVTHKLTIDQKRCRGLNLCHQCEALQPGLVAACEKQGLINIQEWVLREQGLSLSALIVACPDRAIMIMPKTTEG